MLLQLNLENKALLNENTKLQKLQVFNNEIENIAYIEHNNNSLYVITQKIGLDYKGNIKEIEFNGYEFDSLSKSKPRSFIHIRSDVQYHIIDKDNKIPIGLFIYDFISDEWKRDNGYGSIIMQKFISYAKSIESLKYISGKLSFVDIGSEGNRTVTQQRNRERLYHFYHKFGFVIDEKENIKLELK